MALARPIAPGAATGLRLAGDGTLPEGGYGFVSRSVSPRAAAPALSR